MQILESIKQGLKEALLFSKGQGSEPVVHEIIVPDGTPSHGSIAPHEPKPKKLPKDA